MVGWPTRIWCALMVPLWLVVPGFGLIDLQTMFVEDSFFAEVVALETSWGVLVTFFVAAPLAVVAARPALLTPAAALLLTVVLALLLAAPLGGQPDGAVLGLAVAVSTAPVLRVALLRVRRPRWGLDRGVAALAVVAAPASLWYAATAFGQSRTNPSPDEYATMGLDHWPVQGALGLVLATALVTMAVWPGAGLLYRALVALGLATLALSWALHPDTGGSVENPLVAAAALVTAVLLALSRPVGTTPAPQAVRAVAG